MLKFSLVLDMAFYVAVQNSIPNVRKFICTNVSIKGLVVHPYIMNSLIALSKLWPSLLFMLMLSSVDGVANGSLVALYGRRYLDVLFECFPRCSS